MDAPNENTVIIIDGYDIVRVNGEEVFYDNDDEEGSDYEQHTGNEEEEWSDNDNEDEDEDEEDDDPFNHELYTINVTPEYLQWLDFFYDEVREMLETREENGMPYTTSGLIRQFVYSEREIVIMKSRFGNSASGTPFNVAHTLMSLCDLFDENRLQDSILNKFYIVIPIIFSIIDSLPCITTDDIIPMYKKFCKSGVLTFDPEDVYYSVFMMDDGGYYEDQRVGLTEYLTSECEKISRDRTLWDSWEIKTQKQVERNCSYAQWFPREMMEDFVSLL